MSRSRRPRQGRCASWQVRDHCLDLAVNAASGLDQDHGVFEGTLPAERRHLGGDTFLRRALCGSAASSPHRPTSPAGEVGLRQATRQLGIRAIQLAERLGSVNARAIELGTTRASLRKAFTRHGLGMPARNPEAAASGVSPPLTNGAGSRPLQA